jgi:replicative DNA helicase
MNVEHLVLKNLLHNEEFVRSVLPFIKQEYFSDSNDRAIFNFIKTFVNEYNKQATPEAIKILASESKKIRIEDAEVISNLLDSWHTSESTELAFLIKQTEIFCKDKALHNAILDSIKIITDVKDTREKGSIPEILKEALAITFDPSVGHDLVCDAETRYDFYHKKEERIRFDIQNLNYITGGGIPRKTLNIIVAGVNVGKSLAMCHMASANMINGKNVLYITCEMAEERIAERIDANLLDLSLDTLRQVTKKQFMSLIDNLKNRTTGKLVIKEYPTGSANVSHFRYLLHELAIKKNFIPDIIYIDYLNICSSSRIKNNGLANSYTLVKSIAEEVRGLAVEANLPIVTATQFTRCLSVNSLINTPNFLKRLHEIQIGDKVLTTNGEFNTVLKVYPKEVQQAYSIRLKSGKTITCSEKHIFPTPNGMKSISSGLVVGECLFINSATQ